MLVIRDDHFLVSLVQAQYWHDPYDEESYALDCEFLADINQELVSDHVGSYGIILSLLFSFFLDSLYVELYVCIMFIGVQTIL